MTVLFWIAWANIVAAAPSIVFPINSQVPPVARTSKTFQFIFSESTFASSAPSTHYALTNSPGWLHIDSSSRTLSGTPGPGDVGSAAFNLIASDDTGSTSMPVTLIVSSESGPGLGTSISDQLSTHGGFSSPDSLLIPHSASLSLSFLSSTFTNTNEHTLYYAICANNTPLPSWIKFDPATLSFSGTTPQSNSPVELSESYNIKLTASDVVGFSAAVATFQIIVESHLFSFSKNAQIIDALQGSPFSFSGLQTDLTLDGSLAKGSDVDRITAEAPGWIFLNSSTFEISGTPPISAAPQNFTVTAKDKYGDIAKTIICIQFSRVSLGFFLGPFEKLNATAGLDFDYTIDRTLFVNGNISVSVNLGNAEPWLKFDPHTLRFYGEVPTDLRPQEDAMNVTVTQGSESQSQTMLIAVGEFQNNGGSISTTSPNAIDSSPTGNSESSQATPPVGTITQKHWLPAAIIVPLVVVIAFVLSGFLLVRKKRKRRFLIENNCPSEEEISRPMPMDDSWITIQENEVMDGMGNIYSREQGRNHSRIPNLIRRRESSRPPKVEIKGFVPSSPDKRSSRFRWSRASENHGSQNWQRDSWRDYVGKFHGDRHEPVAVAEFSLPEDKRSLRPKTRRRSSRLRHSDTSRYSSFSTAKGYTRTRKSRSGMNFASTSLFSSQHLRGFGRAGSGMGHGMRISDDWYGHNYGGPHGFGIVRGSWRNTNASSKSQNTTEYATTTNSSSRHLTSKHSANFSSLVRAFPRTPTSNTLDIFSQIQSQAEPKSSQSPQRSTIRLVKSPLRTYLRRKSSLQTFHKHRVSSRQAHNPLFSAGLSSRTSSPSLWKKKSLIASIQSPTTNSRYPCPTQNSPPDSVSPRVNLSQSSSRQFHSADDDAALSLGEPFYFDGRDELEEDVDEEGNKFWRHALHPSPLEAHAMSSYPAVPHLESEGSTRGEQDAALSGFRSTLLRGGIPGGRNVQRLSNLREAYADGKVGAGAVAGVGVGFGTPTGGVEVVSGSSTRCTTDRDQPKNEERRFVVGRRGRRPESVDLQGLGRGVSMRGHFRGRVRKANRHDDDGGGGGDDGDDDDDGDEGQQGGAFV